MKGKYLASTAGASIILALFSVLSKGIGLFREIIYANNFGLSREYDIFLSCSAIPIVINTGIIYITQHYFIPLYNQQKKTNNNSQEAFFNYNFWAFILFGCVISVLLFFFSDLIMKFYLSGLTEEQRYTGIKIFLIFLLTIPINSGISIITAYMQAEFNFILPAFIQILLNIVIIIVVVLFSKIMHILVLPYAFLSAYIISFIFISRPLWKTLRFSKQNFRENKGTSKFKELSMLIVIEFSSLSYIVLDRYFINKVIPGGIAALNYAQVIFSLPISIFSISLITTVFSRFSLDFTKSIEELKKNLMISTGVTAFVIIPTTLLMFSLGGEFLALFYQRGSFSAESTALTYAVLKNYLFGLIFYSEYLIIVKIYYSMNRYKEIMVISCAAVILKLFFNFWLVDKFSQNGLALSTSLIYFFLFGSSIYLLKKTTLQQIPYFIIGQIGYFALLAVIAFLISAIFSSLLDINFIYKWVIFMAVYFLSSFLFKDREFKIFLDSFNIFNRIRLR